MKYLVPTARILLGVPLALFGAMGFVMVMPDPHLAWESQTAFSDLLKPTYPSDWE